MRHLEEGTLHALLDGELDVAEAREVEGHLRTCAECSARLADERLLAAESLALVERLQVPDRPSGMVFATRPNRFPARILAWAASILVAAGLGYYSGEYGQVRAVPQVPAEAARDAATAEPQSAPPTTAAPVAAVTSPAAASRPTAAPRSRAEKPPMPEAGRVAAESSGMLTGEPDFGFRGGRNQDGATYLDAVPTVPTSRLESAAKSSLQVADGTSGRPVGLEEAVGVLGGTIRLIDGLAPERVEAGTGGLVRVAYRLTGGSEIYLEQWRLPAPAAAPQALARRDLARQAPALLGGDTLATTTATGLPRLEWLDPVGFRLVLSGDIGADSLLALARRVH
jgi:hypothetical protein